MRVDPANVSQPREPELPDWEAARLLRELADHPRESLIWPMSNGWAWPGNVREALLRAAERLGVEGTNGAPASTDRGAATRDTASQG